MDWLRCSQRTLRPGYTLASQVPTGFVPLSITGLEQDPTFYVLAVTAAEPENGLRQLLLCLQDSQ